MSDSQSPPSPDDSGLRSGATADTDSAARTGTWIGRYRVLDTLGEGGMGSVYLAEQREPVRRRVALKLIKLGMDSRAVVARFEQERQALALMDHEGIAKVFDCGTSDRGQPFFVMELAKGLPLDQYCKQEKLSVDARLVLMQKICDAVQHAHQKGVVHRDLKPGNVLVTGDGDDPRVKIIDFGLAKAMSGKLVDGTLFTEVGQIMGTPAFMAPEQADPTNQDIDTRADVYSLGVMLYQMLVGELPFSTDELREHGLQGLQRTLREVDPPKPSIRLSSLSHDPEGVALRRRTSLGALSRVLKKDLDWVVLKALAKERDRRYATPAALAADLQRFRNHEPLLAGPPSAIYRVRKLLRRYRGQAIAAGLVFAALVIGAIATFVQYLRVERLLDFAAAHVLCDRAEALFPAVPGKAAAMTAWLDEVDRRVGRLEGYRAEAAAAARDPSTSAAELQRGVRDLERLVDLRPAVASRLQRAESLFHETVTAQAAQWRRARAEVAAAPHYGGLVLEPQVGLVPLGANPGGYQEFWHVLSGARPTRGAGDECVVAEDTGMVLVLLPGGSFEMGSPEDEPGRVGSESLRPCDIAAFFISKFEVTQAQWFRAMGGVPALYRAGNGPFEVFGRMEEVPEISVLHPVESVSWQDCVQCATRLDLRLPTEAEWEYAARGGNRLAFVWGDEAKSLAGRENVRDLSYTANSNDNSGLAHDDGYPLHAPVGSFAGNGFGLFDMAGNVSEWCADLYESADRVDAVPWRRVFRGGNWYLPVSGSRVAFRQVNNPRSLNQVIGARFARDLRD